MFARGNLERHNLILKFVQNDRLAAASYVEHEAVMCHMHFFVLALLAFKAQTRIVFSALL